MSFVVASRELGKWLYWTGYVYASGTPKVSASVCEAYHFPSRDAAMCCCDTHEQLRHSDRWYIRKLDPKGYKR